MNNGGAKVNNAGTREDIERGKRNSTVLLSALIILNIIVVVAILSWRL